MKIIAVYPGRFQPMAKHHAETFQWLQDKYGVDNTFILTSGKVDPPRSPFSFEEKQKIINAHGFNNVVQVRSPYRPVELLQNYNEEDTAVVFLLGEKDAERLSKGKYFQKLEGEPTEPFKDRGYVLIAPHVSIPTSNFADTSLYDEAETLSREMFEIDPSLSAEGRNINHNLADFLGRLGRTKDKPESRQSKWATRLLSKFNVGEERRRLSQIKDFDPKYDAGLFQRVNNFLDSLELSGTAAREILSKGDKEQFENIMGFWNEDIYNMIKDKLKQKNEVSQTIYKLVESALEEMSAMGAGAVAGPGGPLQKEEEEEEEVQEEGRATFDPGVGGNTGTRPNLVDIGPDVVADNLKEDDEEDKQEESLKMPLNREEFILREYVRRCLRKIQKEQIKAAKSEILEEIRLKKYIRKVLLEKRGSCPYGTTGGCKAWDLFLEIAKSEGALENTYRSLQTSDEQRASFSDFIIEFVQADFDLAEEFSSNIQDAEAGVGEEVPLEEEDINVVVGDEVEDKKPFPSIEDIEAELNPEEEVEVEPVDDDDEVPSDLTPDEQTGYVAAKGIYDNFLKNQIEKFWVQLKNDNDRGIYKVAVIENLGAYFNKWESEITENPEAPLGMPTGGVADLEI
jgi:hypothetical protein